MHEDVRPFIRDHWNLRGFSLSPLIELELNIANIKSYLKWWNHNVFGNVHQYIKDIEDKLTQQQIKIQNSWYLEGNIKYKKLTALHHKVLIQEEHFWKEKTGEKVIFDRDRNTSYFHAKVRVNKR